MHGNAKRKQRGKFWTSAAALLVAGSLAACGQSEPGSDGQGGGDPIEFDPAQPDQQLQPEERNTGQLAPERPDVDRTTGGEAPAARGTALPETSAMNEATAAFARIDRDASGDIGEQEWDQSDQSLTQQDFNELDGNGDGRIDRSEFLEVAGQPGAGGSNP